MKIIYAILVFTLILDFALAQSPRPIDKVLEDTYQHREFIHREFINDYYDRMYYTIAGTIAVVIAILGFLGWSSRRSIEKRLATIYADRFDKRFKELWSQKNFEVEETTKQLRGKLEGRMKELADELQAKMMQLTKDLEKNINESRETLELLYGNCNTISKRWKK